MARAIALIAVLALPPFAAGASISRTFELTYSADVPRVTGAAPVRLWLPVPQTTAEQKVASLTVTSPAGSAQRTEPVHGNRMLYVELAPARTPATVSWTARVTRRESRGAPAFSGDERARIRRYLDADRLGVVGHPEVRASLERALARRDPGEPVPRAIYDHVLTSMQYDKTVPGWGKGDTVRACLLGKGNCTDFHALFISMNRHAGTPAKFAIGLPLPSQRGEGQISGYHCWAYFLAPAGRWVPVDASEAWKDPKRRDYYFGTLTADRVELSQGRDLVLSPKQAGAPLNYFVDPYAEHGGEPLTVKRTARFRDL